MPPAPVRHQVRMRDADRRRSRRPPARGAERPRPSRRVVAGRLSGSRAHESRCRDRAERARAAPPTRRRATRGSAARSAPPAPRSRPRDGGRVASRMTNGNQYRPAYCGADGAKSQSVQRVTRNVQPAIAPARREPVHVRVTGVQRERGERRGGEEREVHGERRAAGRQERRQARQGAGNAASP